MTVFHRFGMSTLPLHMDYITQRSAAALPNVMEFAPQPLRTRPVAHRPNAITLLGLVFQCVALLTVVATSPTMAVGAPAWVSAVAAIALFCYSTLDNMDGKQARRTGSSSPLGLLFDHGCDCLNSGIAGPLVMMGALGVRPGTWQYVAIWALPALPFFFNSYEEYHTNTFLLREINGPNEGVMALVCTYVVAAFVGTDIWQQPVTQAPFTLLARVLRPVTLVLRLGGVSGGGAPTTAAELQSPSTGLDVLLTTSCIAVACTVVVHTATAVSAAAAAARERGSSAVAASMTALRRQSPMWACLLAAVLWCRVPACASLLAAHPYFFFIAVGAAFARASSRLMLAHVTDTLYEPWVGWDVAVFNLLFVPVINFALRAWCVAICRRLRQQLPRYVPRRSNTTAASTYPRCPNRRYPAMFAALPAVARLLLGALNPSVCLLIVFVDSMTRLTHFAIVGVQEVAAGAWIAASRCKM